MHFLPRKRFHHLLELHRSCTGDLPPWPDCASRHTNRSAAALVKDLKTYGTVGHSATIQPATRLPQDVTDNYDNFYRAGTAIPQRADFNTLDNPFFYSANPRQNRYSSEPAAGLHFVVFVPTIDS